MIVQDLIGKNPMNFIFKSTILNISLLIDWQLLFWIDYSFSLEKNFTAIQSLNWQISHNKYNKEKLIIIVKND